MQLGTQLVRFTGESAIFLAWCIALAASLTVLFIGEILGQLPCSLCWFQRVFMFSIAVILTFGLWWQDLKVGRYGLVLALPGCVFAAWHLALYANIIPQAIKPCAASGPSCTDNNQLLFQVPIPFLALVTFAIIATLCAASLKGKNK